MSFYKIIQVSLISLLLYSCGSDSSKSAIVEKVDPTISFESIPGSVSGITYKNTIDETEPIFNFFNYNHIYIGAGVAVSDFNNDGLMDVFFHSNRGEPTLYKNLGGFKFDKIDLADGLFPKTGMGTGVSVHDVNNDGLLDLYLCYTGPNTLKGDAKRNVLLINKGDFKFEDQTEAAGLSDYNNSIQSHWLDYDKDGDLDLFLVNTNSEFRLAVQVIKKQQFIDQPELVTQIGAQDRLFQNDGTGKFTDVTYAAGIIPEIFFGFSASIGDFNQDGWPDIFVANDFTGPDLLYINSKNGKFEERGTEFFKHTSYFSMGADISDINNDTYDDLIVLDMAPEDYMRSRTSMGMTDPVFFESMVKNEYNNQYMHNMLHINNGNNGFSEVAQLAEIDKTDWSWSVLSEDFNHDGNKDLYITNGIYRNITDKDITHFIKQKLREVGSSNMSVSTQNNLLNELPSEKLSNYLYINNGEGKFDNQSTASGLSTPSFSNGAVAADLDNDGDLDIITNNLMHEAFLYKNNSPLNNYLNIKLEGIKSNARGIGAKICVKTAIGTQCKTINSERGMMSSMPTIAHFGLGKLASVLEIKVMWSNGQISHLGSVDANQILNIKQSEANSKDPFYTNERETYFTAGNIENVTSFVHKENEYNDQAVQVLMPHKLSTLGPALASSDINGDGQDEIFIGGAKGQTSQFFYSSADGYITGKAPFKAENEDVAALFVDINNDGIKDLVVSSASYEFADKSRSQNLQVYLLDKSAKITKSKTYPLSSNIASMVSGDIDSDGDMDLILGGRIIKNEYPKPSRSYVMINENGQLVDKTKALAPDFQFIGMITSMVLDNLDSDKELELAVVGEWMPLTIFNLDVNGKLGSAIEKEGSKGWWNVLKSIDTDNDGDKDLIAGNLGLNYKFSASQEKPFHCYSLDFGDDGTYNIVLAKKAKDDNFLPIRGKSCSTESMPFVGEQFATFTSYAEAKLEDIYGDDLSKALHNTVETFEHTIFKNDGQGNFTGSPLPFSAQSSPMYDLISYDVNGDQIMDLVTVGNQYGSEVETTRADSGNGNVLLGKSDGSYEFVLPSQSGFLANTHARKITKVSDNLLLLANNNEAVTVFNIK